MAHTPARVQVRRAAIPIFRKIFRKRGLFVCGICRSSYQSRSDANNCLNFCWFELQEHYPLVRRRDYKTGSFSYRCQYCARDYKSEYAGIECARMCVEQRNQKHIHEQLINELPLEVKRKHPVRLIQIQKQDIGMAIARPAIAKKTANQSPSSDEVSIQLDETIETSEPESIAHDPEITNDQQQAIASTQPDLASINEGNGSSDEKLGDKLRRRKDSFPKSWIRKDAKYQCCCCLKKYFTKMEVEQCFDGHFDSEGYEILAE